MLNVKKVCKSNPNMLCIATKKCYKERYLRDHSCSGCCKKEFEK